MPNQTKIPLTQEQYKTKPNIEDAAREFLTGDALQNVLDFVAYLRENKMAVRWCATNAWWVKYRGSVICSIRIGFEGSGWHYDVEPGSWHIGHWMQGMKLFDILAGHDELTSNDDFKEFFWANAHYCRNCGGCSPGVSAEILGKNFDLLCRGLFRVKNPDKAGMEHVRELVEIKRQAVIENIENAKKM